VLATVVQEGGVPGHFVVADAMDIAVARRPVTEAIERFGRLDILVNNVGGSVGQTTDPFLADDSGFASTLVLCLTTAWWSATAALPAMRDAGWGRIINIGSGASKATGGTIGYTTAKHGLVGFTRQLAAETAQFGITVNCLCPGYTNTPRLSWDRVAKATNTTPAEAERQATSLSLQARVLEPEELVGMATLLAGDAGGGITGQVISVDGGYKV